MLVNTKIMANPLNWLILLFMVMIPCVGAELIMGSRVHGCGCFKNKGEN